MAVHDRRVSIQSSMFVIARQVGSVSHVPKVTHTHHHDRPTVLGLPGKVKDANTLFFLGFLRARHSHAATEMPRITSSTWAPRRSVDVLIDKL